MTIYRRLTFIVADMNVDEPAELLPAVLTTMGAVESPFGLMRDDQERMLFSCNFTAVKAL